MECNELQQGWFVPHDIPGMVELMGGTERVIADLDTMFDKTPTDFLWNAYYNHANEPVHHVPFLYNHLGQPWKTQKWSRFICDKAYKNKVEGLVRNEDVGQMSAWYVLAACGFVSGLSGRYSAMRYPARFLRRPRFRLAKGIHLSYEPTEIPRKHLYPIR